MTALFPFAPLALAAALSVDNFAVGFAFGVQQTRLRPLCVAAMSAVGALLFVLSAQIGDLVSSSVAPLLLARLGKTALLVFGLWKIADGLRALRSQEPAVPAACLPSSRDLSLREALLLSVLLSSDSLVAGTSGVFSAGPAFLFAASFFCNALALLLGALLARRTVRVLGLSDVCSVPAGFCFVLLALLFG